jgi:hypothetical protein
VRSPSFVRISISGARGCPQGTFTRVLTKDVTGDTVPATGYCNRLQRPVDGGGADRCPSAQRADATAAGSNKSAQQVSRILKPWAQRERLIYLSVGISTESTGIWLYDPLASAVAYDPSPITSARIHIAAECAPPRYRATC